MDDNIVSIDAIILYLKQLKSLVLLQFLRAMPATPPIYCERQKTNDNLPGSRNKKGTCSIAVLHLISLILSNPGALKLTAEDY